MGDVAAAVAVDSAVVLLLLVSKLALLSLLVLSLLMVSMVILVVEHVWGVSVIFEKQRWMSTGRER